MEVFYMEMKDVFLQRQSVRSFAPDPISDEDVDYLLHSAMCAPSAMNRQPWEFYVVLEPNKRRELSKIGFARYESPLILVAAGNAHRFIPFAKDYWLQDVSAASENLLLAAVDRGLGAVWCGVYPVNSLVKKVREVLELPDYIIPLNIIHVGHPAERTAQTHEKFNSERIHRV